VCLRSGGFAVGKRPLLHCAICGSDCGVTRDACPSSSASASSSRKEALASRALGSIEQVAAAHHAATNEPIGGRCRDVLEAAARVALIAEGVRIGLCEHEVRLTIESAFTAGRERPRCSPNRLR
jgi:hypothetical protein